MASLSSAPLPCDWQVVDIFLREWRGPIILCAPLYEDAYEDKRAAAPK